MIVVFDMGNLRCVRRDKKEGFATRDSYLLLLHVPVVSPRLLAGSSTTSH